MIRFFSSLIVALAIIPITNIALNQGSVPQHPYSLDLIKGSVAYELYKSGVSVNPRQVIVGKEGWLFLGNQHASTVVRSSSTAKEDELRQLDAKLANFKEWSDYFERELGAKMFLVVGPNKSSIYPEYVPETISVKPDNLANQQASKVSDSPHYINPTEQLKKTGKHLTYYKTDTHWNKLGGYIAYMSLMDRIRETENVDVPAVNLGLQDFQKTDRKGGDLARFLSAQNYFFDTEMQTEPILAGFKIVSLADETVSTFDHSPYLGISPSQGWLHAHNTKALNDTKVLWIRDSFGTSMSSYMFSTFTDVYSAHSSFSTPEKILKLSRDVQFDFLVFTKVERNTLGDYIFFSKSPEDTL